MSEQMSNAVRIEGEFHGLDALTERVLVDEDGPVGTQIEEFLMDEEAFGYFCDCRCPSRWMTQDGHISEGRATPIGAVGIRQDYSYWRVNGRKIWIIVKGRGDNQPERTTVGYLAQAWKTAWGHTGEPNPFTDEKRVTLKTINARLDELDDHVHFFTEGLARIEKMLRNIPK